MLAAAHELGDRGLRANVINPGPVDTGWMDDAIRASGLASQPLGRLGTPRDIANLVRFLLSDAGQLDQRPAPLQQRRLPERPPPRRSRFRDGGLGWRLGTTIRPRKLGAPARPVQVPSTHPRAPSLAVSHTVRPLLL